MRLSAKQILNRVYTAEGLSGIRSDKDIFNAVYEKEKDALKVRLKETPTGTFKIAEALFNVDDWSLNAGRYELTIAHNMDSGNVLFKVFIGYSEVVPEDFIFVSANTLKLLVPSNPDCRFSGNIILHGG